MMVFLYHINRLSMQGRCARLKVALSPEPTCKYLLNKMRRLRNFVQASIRTSVNDTHNVPQKQQNSILDLICRKFYRRASSFSVWNVQRRRHQYNSLVGSALFVGSNSSCSASPSTSSEIEGDNSNDWSGSNDSRYSSYRHSIPAAVSAAALSSLILTSTSVSASEEDPRLSITDEQFHG